MTEYIVGYTIVALIVIFIVFSILVKKRILFGDTVAMQKIFAHPLLHYSLRRIGSAMISLVLAVIVTFFLIRLAMPPEDTCITFFATPTCPVGSPLYELRCETWMKQMGFHGSILEQLGSFFYNVLPVPKTLCVTSIDHESLTFVIQDCRNFVINFGTVYQLAGTPEGSYVLDYMGTRMITSFKIGIIAVVLELALGYAFGILMAKNQNGIFDKIGKTYIISIDAIPGVAYYYIWMALLCGLFMLPQRYEAGNFLSWLPIILTMGFTGMAGIGLWVRRYMVDEFNADYVKFARSKGMTEGRIMKIHILRNAVVPLVRTFPSAVLGALLGTYYLENIYGVPGIGQAIIVANDTKNSSLLIGVVIISALLSIISYLLGDIVTALVDPRISFTK